MSKIIFMSSGSYNCCARRQPTRGWCVLLSLLTAAGFTSAIFAQETKNDPNRIIQYRGPMPLLRTALWGSDVELRFDLHRSPNGGVPFWSEIRKVAVKTNGWVSVDLGTVSPLPDEAFITPFRFLAIWHGNTEFVPRKQVASVVYITSAYEAGTSKADYLERAITAAANAASKAPARDNRLDVLVNCGDFSMEKHPRLATDWLSAASVARKLGADLPTFDEWYGAYDGKPGKELAGMEGHYEWVIPWVYEPMIHGRLHELYRGKPVACYYEELSPQNNFPYRLLKRSQRTAP